MTKTGFPLLPYLKAKNRSLGTNDFNDLENRKSRGTRLQIRLRGNGSTQRSIISIAICMDYAAARPSMST